MQICSWICSLKPYSNAMAQSSSCSAPWYFLPDKPGLLENVTHQQKKSKSQWRKQTWVADPFQIPFCLAGMMLSSHWLWEALLMGQGSWFWVGVIGRCCPCSPPAGLSFLLAWSRDRNASSTRVEQPSFRRVLMRVFFNLIYYRLPWHNYIFEVSNYMYSC